MASRRSSSRHSRVTKDASLTKHAAKLPSWARVTAPKRRMHEPLSLPEEERYVRTMTYHESARIVDLAVSETLQQLGEETIRLIESMAKSHLTPHGEKGGREKDSFDRNGHAEDEGSDLPPPLNQAIEEGPSSWHQRIRQLTSTSFTDFDPLLLPVLLLEAPHHPLDRLEWSRMLVKLSKRRSARICVVWLQADESPADTASTSASLATMIEELSRQCLWQEHESTQASQTPPALSPVELRRCSHCSELFRLWARRTREFDGVLVIVNSESVHESFLTWAAEQRESFGIPLTIVLLQSTMRTSGDPLSWHLQSHSQYWVRRWTLPLSRQVLEQVWYRLYVHHDLSYHLPELQTRSMVEAFSDQHGSFVQTLLHLKASLAQFFALHVGSGLMARCSPATEDLPTSSLDLIKRRQWFLLDPQAKKLILGKRGPKEMESTGANDHRRKHSRSDDILEVAIISSGEQQVAWLEDLEQCRRQLAIIKKVEACLKNHIKPAREHELSLNLSLELLCSVDPTKESLPKDAVKEMLCILLQAKREEMRKNSSNLDSGNNEKTNNEVRSEASNKDTLTTMAFINRIVVLLDQAAYASDVIFAFESVYRKWYACVQRGFLRPHPTGWDWPPPWSVQPRQDTTDVIIESAEARPTGETIPGILYRLMGKNYSITLDEWVTAFLEHRESQLSREPAEFTTFAAGVYALQLQGLIRAGRKTSSGKYVFDKSVLAWRSGD